MTATVGLQGGTLTVTTHGTTFILSIPKNSVWSAVLTMTPVTALAHSGGTFVAGVMVQPLGTAPPGTVLEIKRSSIAIGTVAKAFGGVDPSGGVFLLPTLVTKDTKLPIESFGGYGLVVQSRVHAARPAFGRACEGTRAAARRNGVPMSCLSLAQREQQVGQDGYAMLAAGQPIGALRPMYEAAAAELDKELSSIANQPPTDAGAAQVELELEVSIDIGRQADLLGFHDVAAELGQWIYKAAEYNWKLITQTCTGSGQHPSEVYLETFFDVIMVARIMAIYGQFADFEAMEKACMKRVKLNLNGKIDGTVDNGQWTEHVVVSATNKIQGTDQPGLKGNDPILNFETAESTADAQLKSENGTATTTSTNGSMYGTPTGASATRRVECINGKPVLIRQAFVYVPELDLFKDNETVLIEINGYPGGSLPSSAADQSWHEKHYTKGETVKLQVNGPQDKQHSSGKCSQSVECLTYGFSSTLGVTSARS